MSAGIFLLLQGTSTEKTREFEPDTIWHTFNEIWTGFISHLPYIVIGLIVVFIFMMAARIVRSLIHAAGRRTRLDRNLALVLGRLASFGISILGIFVGAVVIFPAFRPGDLVAGLGITSVAIGFAFKDVLQNFFAGILILWRQPFKVGDQIRFKEFEGTVEEITVRSTRIKTFDGERAVIPNGETYTNAVLVKTAYRERRQKLVVRVAYSESIRAVRSVLRHILDKTDGVLREPEPTVFVSDLAQASVQFTLLYWVDAVRSDLIGISDDVTEGVRNGLDEAGIKIA